MKLSIEELKKGGLFVATPMYGMQCVAPYNASMINLAQACGMYGIKLHYATVFHSIVMLGRNQLSHLFMNSDATHLMFIDADVGFDYKDVLYLKNVMADNSPYDIIGGCYPKKVIHWPTVRQAALAGIEADKLENYTSDNFNGKFNVIFKNMGTDKVDINKPVEVEGLATGFMMIKKSAMKTFAEKYPEYKYYDHDTKTDVAQFFHAEVFPNWRGYDHYCYISEDNWFCSKANDIGLKTWLCPWMKIDHTGNHTFKGSIIDTAKLMEKELNVT